MRNVSRRLGSIAGAALLAAAGPVAADTRIERELALAPGGRLVVDADGGSVRVAGSSRSGVHVVITSEDDDLEKTHDLRFEERAGEVEIVARRKRDGRRGDGWSLMSFFRGGSHHGLRIEIEAPEETFVAVDTSGGSIEVSSLASGADLDTSGGSIRARDVTGSVHADTSGGAIQVSRIDGDVEADTSGGSISVESVRGSVHADTSGGSIRASDVTGDLRAGTSGGSIQISGAGGEVNAETSGGSVRVEFAAGNASGGTISASGGGVRVVLDPSVGLDIDAAASGGSVSSDVNVKSEGAASRSQLRGTLGAGGKRLRLRSSGGGIKIEAL